MDVRKELYIGGRWVGPAGDGEIDVIDSRTEDVMGRVPRGGEADVPRAVTAARSAFLVWSQTSVAERTAALRALADGLEARTEQLAELMSREVGTPIAVSRRVQAGLAVDVFRSMAEVIDELGLPPGTVNVISGPGSQIGELLAAHPDVDMVSITGSTQAGARVAQTAARTVKRVTLELGGKSPFILLDDTDLTAALPAAVRSCFVNNGQTCAALTRLIVPRRLLPEVEEGLADLIGAMRVGDPLDPGTDLGPVVSAGQRQSIRGYIEQGSAEDATLVAGGPDAPEGLDRGFYVRPTVFSEVTPDMTIAREEIFGPVLAVLPADGEDEAVRIANDSDYGLAGGVWSADQDRAVAVARRLRTGQVAVNGGRFNVRAPFGGYRASGVGRELGEHGLAEYFELTSLQLPAGS